MTKVIPPGYADCSMKFTLGTFPRSAYCTFGVKTNYPDPQDTATHIKNAFNVALSWKDMLDNNASLTEIKVTQGVVDGAPLIGLYSVPVPGGAGHLSCPVNCAVLVTKVTNFGGRTGKGRMYAPWVLEESEVDEAGVITPIGLTQYSGRFANFFDNLVTELVPMYLLHDDEMKGPDGEVLDPIPDPYQVKTLAVSPIIGTQRRRLGRR